ncbi:MAG: helix-turn-helix transcriptional regulator [Rudaea sp.]|uniref:helix-turn-helix domain-containing protein n=1 Tax=unclassified Rudaea TaxID=2627037 RepID=UPI0010F794A1|nr:MULTISPECIES: helix-turn-helix transcriptional regulator [unclassified Rudaea]MBN8887592.1 helix-turn-helix transcriptional regulator [Rudaea sp.]
MDNEFGARLKKLRTDSGLTVREVGEAVGVGWTQISRYERGLAMPRPKLLLELCAYFKVTLEFLRDGLTAEEEWRRMEASGIRLDEEEMQLELAPDVFRMILERSMVSKRTFRGEVIYLLEQGIKHDIDQLKDQKKKKTRR